MKEISIIVSSCKPASEIPIHSISDDGKMQANLEASQYVRFLYDFFVRFLCTIFQHKLLKCCKENDNDKRIY